MYKPENFSTKEIFFQEKDPKKNPENVIDVFTLWITKVNENDPFFKKDKIKFKLYYWNNKHKQWINYAYLKTIEEIELYISGCPKCYLEDVTFPYHYKQVLHTDYQYDLIDILVEICFIKLLENLNKGLTNESKNE